MQAELGQLLEVAKSAGPWGLLTAYLLYKDLYKPWRNGKDQQRSAANGKVYVRESDFAGLSQTLRDHREQYRVDMTEIRDRLLTLERRP